MMVLEVVLELKLFALLVIINGAPIVARNLLPMLNAAIDGGKVLPWDKRPLLGKSKTWRGLMAGILAGMLAATLLGFPWQHGIILAIASLCGDLLTSFIKRRLDFKTSAKAPILDQFLEVSLPLGVAQHLYALNTLNAVGVLAAFILFNWGISPLLYRLGWRKKPY
ncbi:CDP-archaeol synthase [Hahella ganghwensis]|uniref:CDP-archaeol synthase n=1 Tax=Hahella ganghwensis TaxID=286420 RepID=UPI0003808EE1|nr:CDP-archaeol synthase [Hahella ganghwensis]